MLHREALIHAGNQQDDSLLSSFQSPKPAALGVPVPGPVSALQAAIPDAEVLTDEDRAYLRGLAERRRIYLDSRKLIGWVRPQGNYTVCFLGFLGPRCGIGIAKRNPAADAPVALRGRQIALARAMFDLLRAEGRMPEEGR